MFRGPVELLLAIVFFNLANLPLMAPRPGSGALLAAQPGGAPDGHPGSNGTDRDGRLVLGEAHEHRFNSLSTIHQDLFGKTVPIKREFDVRTRQNSCGM